MFMCVCVHIYCVCVFECVFACVCVYDCVSKNALCMGVFLCVVCVVYEYVECKCVHVSVV